MRVNATKPIADKLILEQLKNSNQGVFEIIFKYYYSGLVVYADQVIRNTPVSEDIVQSVFMKLWETRQSLEIRSFRAYLMQSVKNRCIDHIRSQAVKIKYNSHITESDQFEMPQDLWSEVELDELLQRAMDKLPPRCREIFMMSRIDKLKIAEIAEKLQLSGRTVETQISKAIKILRVELAEYMALFIFFLT
ncbi:MAG TPA: RNA polymerase sigma-70 factor [Prolixibacteraceae bacterium]|nr:RNA polymerase sigma-70 factor [Prolixibacteraceae bacterium]